MHQTYVSTVITMSSMFDEKRWWERDHQPAQRYGVYQGCACAIFWCFLLSADPAVSSGRSGISGWLEAALCQPSACIKRTTCRCRLTRLWQPGPCWQRSAYRLCPTSRRGSTSHRYQRTAKSGHIQRLRLWLLRRWLANRCHRRWTGENT